MFPKVCSADHWWFARLAQEVRESQYKSIFFASRSTKIFLVVHAPEKFGNHCAKGSSINDVMVVMGSSILWQQCYGLSNKKCDDGEGGQKMFKIAWRHLWTIPDCIYATDFNMILNCLKNIISKCKKLFYDFFFISFTIECSLCLF